MARPIPCDAPGCNNAANYLLSIIDTGRSQGLCAVHMAQFAAALVMQSSGEQLTEDEAQALAATVREQSEPSAEMQAAEMFECPACGEQYADEGAVSEHLATVHTDEAATLAAIRERHPEMFEGDDTIDGDHAIESEPERVEAQ